MTPEGRTVLTEVARAAGRAALKEIPFVGKLMTVLTEAEIDARKTRKELWATWLIGNDDNPEAYATRIEEALRGAEGSVVRAAVNESLRAALDALDEIVIPSIALLTRLYLNTKTPDRRTYREIISILRVLDQSEFVGLRQAVGKLAWIEGDPVVTALYIDPQQDVMAAAADTDKADQDDESRWVWYAVAPKPAVILATGEIAPRLVAATERLHGSLYMRYREPEPSKNKPRFARAVIQLLAEVMPEVPLP
jgi:hypothetical protein